MRSTRKSVFPVLTPASSLPVGSLSMPRTAIGDRLLLELRQQIDLGADVEVADVVAAPALS